ncbi:hypothetical protein [Pedobacter sp. L105]|uniref:hypothetical protein n=1 Tax=Pedobacter sp. L105 TaxID=1641871 RepID=UPI00131D1A8A|nr:hypothetical protein [Pedobacter sp. L105]
MKEYINRLKKEAVYVRLEAKEKIARAINVHGLIKVLNCINQSYKNFLEIQLNKDSAYAQSNQLKEPIPFIRDNELLIVDLDFSSFGAAVIPDTLTVLDYTGRKISSEKKKQIFNDFKNDVIYADFSDEKFVERISKTYSGEERNEIYKPFLTNIYKNKHFDFYCGSNKNNLKKISDGLSKKVVNQLIPKIKQTKDMDLRESVHAMYVTASDENDITGKKQYSKVLATEKLELAVYPYQLSKIKVDHHNYLFNNKLSADVSYEDDLFYIKYLNLNIEVWGKDREEAEAAFDFMLKQTITNIYLEKNENLMPKAQVIKENLSKLIIS